MDEQALLKALAALDATRARDARHRQALAAERARLYRELAKCWGKSEAA